MQCFVQASIKIIKMETESGFKLGETTCHIYFKEKIAENLLATAMPLKNCNFPDVNVVWLNKPQNRYFREKRQLSRDVRDFVLAIIQAEKLVVKDRLILSIQNSLSSNQFWPDASNMYRELEDDCVNQTHHKFTVWSYFDVKLNVSKILVFQINGVNRQLFSKIRIR